METFREYFKNKFMAQKGPRQYAGGQRVKKGTKTSKHRPSAYMEYGRAVFAQ